MADYMAENLELGIDTETDGWHADGGVAIQIGIAIRRPSTGEIIATYERLVARPDDTAPWSLGAEAVHGISQDRVRAEGVDRSVVAQEILAFLRSHMASPKAKFVLFGQNIPFDIPFIEDILGKGTLDGFVYSGGAVDQMVLADTVNKVWMKAGRPAPFWNKGRPSPAMDGQRVALGLSMEGAHTALKDVLQEMEANEKVMATLALRVGMSYKLEAFKKDAACALDRPEVLRQLVEDLLK